MDITPVIPDGYNGSIKQLTCRICKHIFYLTMADYGQLGEVSYCHECSLILMEELAKSQGSRYCQLSENCRVNNSGFRLKVARHPKFLCKNALFKISNEGSAGKTHQENSLN